MNAEGVRGFILYNPFTGNRWFRIYNDDKTYKDYELRVEDLEVMILSKRLVLREEDGKRSLDWDLK